MTTLHEAAAAILSTLVACAWMSRNVLQDDKDTSTANEYILDSLSNADLVRTIDTITDGDLRSQLTVGQALELYDEIELRRFERRN